MLSQWRFGALVPSGDWAFHSTKKKIEVVSDMEQQVTQTRFAALCKNASDEWLIRQLRSSIVKWLTISYPDGFDALTSFEREAYGDNDRAVIDEIERRLKQR